MLDKQQNGGSGNNFRRIFHRIFSKDNLLVIPFLIFTIIMMMVVCSGGLKENSPAYTTPTSITENITTTKENTTQETTTQEIITESTTEVITTKEPTTREPTTEVPTTSERVTEKVIEKIPEKPSYSSNFGAFKSYTDYRCLSRSSAQWKLQEQAYTDENGLRKIGDAYLVAMGSYYGTALGTKYKVTLSNGNSFTVMLCDFKDNRHTDANNQICLSNGSVIEFYVDSDAMPSIVRQMGSVGALSQFSGSIVSIEKTT